MKNKRNIWHTLFILPSILGVLLFYGVPFIYSFYYAVIDNMAEKNFIGISNFIDLAQNSTFQLASNNTLLFIAVSIPFNMVLSFALALLLYSMNRNRKLMLVMLLLPLIIPSGAIINFWKVLFDYNGVINKVLYQLGFTITNYSKTDESFLIMILIYTWKNIGYCIIIFISGLSKIPRVYYDQYRLEGATPFQVVKNVTLIYISPTAFVVLLMSFINSFKVFKEIYLLYGAYPANRIYTLQHYMNNQFLAINLQKLSAAAYFMFVVIGFVLFFVFRIQKKITDNYY